MNQIRNHRYILLQSKKWMDPINLSANYPFDKKSNLERGSYYSVWERSRFVYAVGRRA